MYTHQIACTVWLDPNEIGSLDRFWW